VRQVNAIHYTVAPIRTATATTLPDSTTDRMTADPEPF
jgi:hypothetical protein